MPPTSFSSDPAAAGTFRPKAIFVGDNSLAANWGRAASLALEELLKLSFDVVGKVTGNQFVLKKADVGYVGTLLPSRFRRLFHYCLENRNRLRFCRWYMRLEELYGAHDFVSHDPSKTVDEILSGAQTHSYFSELLKSMKSADVLILDGDGDIIFTNPPRRETLYLLAMIELGSRLGKEVFLVNTMIPNLRTADNHADTMTHASRLFSRCRAISVRDPQSAVQIRSLVPEGETTFIPDSLFAWQSRYQDGNSMPHADRSVMIAPAGPGDNGGQVDLTKPYVCIGGGALSASDPKKSVESYSRLVDALRTLGLPLVLTENDTPDSFLREVARRKGLGLVPATAPILAAGSVLANARLFVSGRYHPSILASLGGTPCVFLGSHAHKMQSLAEILEYRNVSHFDPQLSESTLTDLVSLARTHLAEGEALRASIRATAKRRSEEAQSLPGYILRHSKFVRPSSVKEAPSLS